MAAELQQRLHHAACIPELDLATIAAADKDMWPLRVVLHIAGGHHMRCLVDKTAPARGKERGR